MGVVDGCEIAAGREKDLPFIVDAIIYSERSGQSYCFYERAFRLAESELRGLLEDILNENIPSSELCIENFRVLRIDGEPTAALSCWIEGPGSQSSGFVKAMMFRHFLPVEKWQRAQPAIERIDEIAIPRTTGVPQIESVYVDPASRGKGILRKLIDFACDEYMAIGHRSIEMISVIENLASAKAFLKCGFSEKARTQTNCDDIKEIFPGTGKIRWVREIF